MLTRLVVKNFKSIGPDGLDLELKPLTIFVGPNGGGKSSILDALAFLTQDGPDGRLWHGPPNLQELIHQRSARATAELRIDSTDLGFAEWGCEFTSSSNPSWLGRTQQVLQAQANTWLIRTTRGDIPFEPQTGQNPVWVGPMGENLDSLLAIIAQREHRDIAAKIVRWAGAFGLGDVTGAFGGGSRLRSQYVDDKLDVVLDLALASSGARQVIAVITQLFWSKPGSLIMIEEPEISLHPEAQVKLVEMFAEALAEDKQLLITTHSSFLLLALSQPIAEGRLSADQVAVYDVTKTSRGTQAKRLPLTKEGYLKGWVPSFAKVESKLLKERVKSLPEA